MNSLSVVNTINALHGFFPWFFHKGFFLFFPVAIYVKLYYVRTEYKLYVVRMYVGFCDFNVLMLNPDPKRSYAKSIRFMRVFWSFPCFFFTSCARTHTTVSIYIVKLRGDHH